MSKEKTRQRPRKKTIELEIEPVEEEQWLRVLERARQRAETRGKHQALEAEEEAVLVLPLAEEEEKTLEEMAKEAVKRLSSRYVWIAKKGRYGFMFVIPEGAEDVEQWSAEWAGFTIEWCKEMLLHIVSTRTLVMLEPFNELRPDRHRAVRIILDKLVREQLGRWVNEAEGILRVTWRTDDEWAEDIRSWALKTGRTTFSLFKLREYRRDLASLPETELRIILDALVRKGQARWLDGEKEVLQIEI